MAAEKLRKTIDSTMASASKGANFTEISRIAPSRRLSPSASLVA
jgi:hypothetical protein